MKITRSAPTPNKEALSLVDFPQTNKGKIAARRVREHILDFTGKYCWCFGIKSIFSGKDKMTGVPNDFADEVCSPWTTEPV